MARVDINLTDQRAKDDRKLRDHDLASRHADRELTAEQLAELERHSS